MLLNIHIQEYYSNNGSNSSNISDWIAAIALILSLVTAYFTYKSIFIAKKLEVSLKVFEQNGIGNIERLLEPIDFIFEQKGDDILNLHINTITEGLTDLELYVVSFCALYKGFDHFALTKIKDDFSDLLYLNLATENKYYKAQFLAFKTRFIHQLYKHATQHQLLH